MTTSNTNGHFKTIVTVTSVAGKPSFSMPGQPTRAAIANAILGRYGYYMINPRFSATPHFFYSVVVPDAEAADLARRTSVGAFGHTGEALRRSDSRFNTGC